MLLALLVVAESSPRLFDGPDLTRYFLACGGLLAVVVLVGLVFRRFFARALSARAARRSLGVVDTLPLGGSKRVVVVRCYDRLFLVGQGEKELCAIAELDPDEGAAEVGGGESRPAEVPRPPVPASFAEALGRSAGVVPRSPRSARPRRPVLEDERGILG